MTFLGNRLVYTIIVAAFFVLFGRTMVFLNDSYDAARAAGGPEVALRFALSGLGALVLAQWLVILPLACRLRNAGRSLLWALPAIVPFVGIVAFIPAIFLAEK